MKDIRLSMIVLALAFLAGAIGGNLTAMLLTGGDELTEYIGGFWDGMNAGTLYAAFAGTLLAGMAIPLLIFLSGFSSLGVALIPVCVAFKGFTFSYAVSAMLRFFGPNGFLLTVCALGVTNLIYIPCMLMSALFAFRTSLVMASVFFGKNKQIKAAACGPVYFIPFAVCFAVILGLAAYQAFLQPMLLSAAAGTGFIQR
ncbi:MAG: hypothetical protein FWH06_02740 [Oscillospiraceae bacterium]|nr:hypothetical protein [Oscillospiraceae bacterium]